HIHPLAQRSDQRTAARDGGVPAAAVRGAYLLRRRRVSPVAWAPATCSTECVGGGRCSLRTSSSHRLSPFLD
uniref:Uncharacterized protein n=1 Tax=Oryza barthii TaxID=65489 RepID=A0A0D3GHR1_9ORYZ